MARPETILVGMLVAASMIVSCDPPPEDLATFLAGKKALYSQEQEELLIRHFFGDRRNGFYLDIGCYDYKTASTTYYLEKHLGWSGIGVDAQGLHAIGWRKHRPRSKFLAYAVTDRSGETITLHQFGGMSATELDTKNLETWKAASDSKGPGEVTVPTITIDDLMEREGVEEIDFVSMDINGAEPIALAGFDIGRFAPALVHVEASPHRRGELMAYFKRHGYVRIDAYLEYDETNWYFRPKK